MRDKKGHLPSFFCLVVKSKSLATTGLLFFSLAIHKRRKGLFFFLSLSDYKCTTTSDVVIGGWGSEKKRLKRPASSATT